MPQLCNYTLFAHWIKKWSLYSKALRYVASTCTDLWDTYMVLNWFQKYLRHAICRGFAKNLCISKILSTLCGFCVDVMGFYQHQDARILRSTFFSRNQNPRNSRSYCRYIPQSIKSPSCIIWNSRNAMQWYCILLV